MTTMSLRTLCACLALISVSNVAEAQRAKRGSTDDSHKSAPGATYDACKLLSLADVTPIIGEGGSQTNAMHGQNCEFVSANKKHKLFVRTPESTRTEPEVTLKNYRKGPHHDYKLNDESGIGDDAVSAITPFGVEIMALKNHKILYIQDAPGYGTKGSSEELNKLLPLAKKAASVF